MRLQVWPTFRAEDFRAPRPVRKLTFVPSNWEKGIKAECVPLTAMTGAEDVPDAFHDDFTLRSICRQYLIMRTVVDCAMELVAGQLDYISNNSVSNTTAHRRKMVQWIARQRNLAILKERVDIVGERLRAVIDEVWSKEPELADLAKRIFVNGEDLQPGDDIELLNNRYITRNAPI